MNRMALATCLAVALLQSSPRTQQSTFRSSVDFVELDVFATDGRGAFVKDLTADDFEILDDGRPQVIGTFRFVDLPLPATSAPVTPARESDVATNTGSEDERLWVMLLDAPERDRGPIYTRQTQNVARGFVESIGPNDSMAVIHVQGSQRASQPLTTSRARLFESIERFSQGTASGVPTHTSFEIINRTRTTFQIIQEVAQRLGAISGRRKAIVWIGGQMPFDLANLSPQLPFVYQEMIRTAQRNNVVVYSIDPSGLANSLNYQGSLRVIAEDTGGLAVTNTSNFSRGFREIVRDNSTYYLVGYYPNPLHRDGEFHRITVRTRRPGLTVRARRGYLAPTATEAPPASLTSIDELTRALRNPVPRRDVLIEIAATPLGSTETAGSVLLTASARTERSAGDGGAVDVAVRVINAEGQTLADRATKYPLVGDRADSAGHITVRFTDRIDLPRGRHEIRLAMHLPGGKTGSVVTYVDVPNFKENRLALSGLSVESATRDGISVFSGEGSDPSDTVVTTARRFPSSATLRVRAGVYGKLDRADDKVVVTALLRDESGAAVRENLTVLIEPSGRISQARIASVQVPLADLRPGAYTLVVNAGTARNRRPAATRELPLWVAEP